MRSSEGPFRRLFIPIVELFLIHVVDAGALGRNHAGSGDDVRSS